MYYPCNALDKHLIIGTLLAGPKVSMDITVHLVSVCLRMLCTIEFLYNKLLWYRKLYTILCYEVILIDTYYHKVSLIPLILTSVARH